MFGKELREVKCEHCGKLFETTHPAKKYCSARCLHRATNLNAQARKHLRICLNCGVGYQGRTHSSFCCEECAEKYRRIRIQKKKCKTCYYSAKVGTDTLCNYHSIAGISRTSLGCAEIPCTVYVKKEWAE